MTKHGQTSETKTTVTKQGQTSETNTTVTKQGQTSETKMTVTKQGQTSETKTTVTKQGHTRETKTTKTAVETSETDRKYLNEREWGQMGVTMTAGVDHAGTSRNSVGSTSSGSRNYQAIPLG